MRRRGVVVAVVVLLASVAVATACDRTNAEPAAAETLRVEIVDRYPHDPSAFTEGLVFDGAGRLFESLGLPGQSSVRRVEPETGVVLSERPLDANLFGEGLAVRGTTLTQLTWRDGVVLSWSARTLEPGARRSLPGESWGLTYDGSRFIKSDGTSRLLFYRPNLERAGQVVVKLDGKPVDELNELEWVDGVVYANVWHSDEIMRIDPESGRVTGVIDATNLWRDPARTTDMTLNGIAHRPGDPPDRLWLTGKNWPEMFEVRITSSER